jgi:hypothetical protein
MFAALDAGCTLAPWWRSGQLDRLLDEAHAALTAGAAGAMRRAGWDVEIEVTFSIFGERGSIDVVGTKAVSRRALMVEVKPTLTSTEELNRTADKKARLLPQIIAERHGWRPTSIGKLLVVGNASANRRRVARAAVLDIAFPIRGDEATSWLRLDTGGGSALMFVSPSTGRAGIHQTTTRQRVRRPRLSTK